MSLGGPWEGIAHMTHEFPSLESGCLAWERCAMTFYFVLNWKNNCIMGKAWGMVSDIGIGILMLRAWGILFGVRMRIAITRGRDIPFIGIIVHVWEVAKGIIKATILSFVDNTF